MASTHHALCIIKCPRRPRRGSPPSSLMRTMIADRAITPTSTSASSYPQPRPELRRMRGASSCMHVRVLGRATPIRHCYCRCPRLRPRPRDLAGCGCSLVPMLLVPMLLSLRCACSSRADRRPRFRTYTHTHAIASHAYRTTSSVAEPSITSLDASVWFRTIAVIHAPDSTHNTLPIRKWKWTCNWIACLAYCVLRTAYCLPVALAWHALLSFAVFRCLRPCRASLPPSFDPSSSDPSSASSVYLLLLLLLFLNIDAAAPYTAADANADRRSSPLSPRHHIPLSASHPSSCTSSLTAQHASPVLTRTGPEREPQVRVAALAGRGAAHGPAPPREDHQFLLVVDVPGAY